MGGWALYVVSHVSQDHLTHRVAWLGYSGSALVVVLLAHFPSQVPPLLPGWLCLTD